MAGGGGLLLVGFVLVALCLGASPRDILNLLQPQGPVAGIDAPAPGPPASGQDDELAQFVGVVLADTEEVWREQFRELGSVYEEPTLVLFSGSVQSACGFQSAATGPFYCPLDRNVFIDLAFYEELRRRLGAPGDFAQAYVIAHEVGHHVQKLLGVSDEVDRLQRRAGRQEANELSVRLELQADFLAGLWAHHAQQNWQILEDGDIEEALRAAAAIGDDRLQSQSQGYVVPESFTHGSSEQRVRWFSRGLRTGDYRQGDTLTPPFDQL
jgi:predicted metalloprotease